MQDVRTRLYKLIDSTPNLDWLLLTKRPENIRRMMPKPTFDHAVWNGTLDGYWYQMSRPRPNLWIGTSIENQQAADERIPHLLSVPAAVRFLSCEPLLGPVILHKYFAQCKCGHGHGFTSCPNYGGVAQTCHKCECRKLRSKISWVIVGGESGPGARPMHPNWARSLRDQCQAAGVPFFFKQWGEYGPTCAGDPKVEGVASDPALKVNDPRLIVLPMSRVSKKSAGRMLDGREWSEFPKGGAS